jgi:hypothetical protein
MPPANVGGLKIFRLILNMDPSRDEVRCNESSYPIVGIHLGIQPSASRSHWSGAEVHY